MQRMLADQARYDDEEEQAGAGSESQFDSGDIELTEDNVDDFVNYINSLS